MSELFPLRTPGRGRLSAELADSRFFRQRAARKALDAVGVQSQADSDGTSNGDQTNA